MKIESIILRNFRCFADSPVTVELAEDLTALVGANGSGKTALLTALTRLFGTTQNMRTIRHSDFHVPPGGATDDPSSVDLSIEVVLIFPELSGGAETSNSVAPAFNHMIVDSPGGDPFCRLRLEARWTDDGTIEGHVEQDLYWLLTVEDPVPDNKKQRVTPNDRGRIQVHYIPANRDPAPEFRSAARNSAGRLVRAISWVQGTRDAVQTASEKIRDTLGSEQAVSVINGLLQRRWDELRDDYASANTILRFGGSGFEEIIRDVGVVFSETDGSEGDLSGLSEGQQSLFYMALVAAVFDVERQVVGLSPSGKTSDANQSGTTVDQESSVANAIGTSGFLTDRFKLIPDLIVFALEEPENHLAPHYLARIIGLLRSLTETGRAQAVFSSHSPSVLRRVSPEEIRHLRLDSATHISIVKKITLPEPTDDSSKFVREAVVTYPELYFGKFVILAEGPSEEVVLPKLAAALDLPIDRSFVCVVPLGGRHVNHLWRLLTDLEIPYATLLDLDAGRQTGGWARIKYVCDQLLRIGIDQSELLEFEYDSHAHYMSKEDLDNLHKQPFGEFSDLLAWVRHLEKFGVFFSRPLDFDLHMLRRFPDAYKNIEAGYGPAIPAEDSPEWEPYVRRAIEVAVGNDETVIEQYMKGSREWKELFPWYRYLFTSRSKPATHIQALAELGHGELKENAPPPLLRLLDRCKIAISQWPKNDGALE